MTADSARPSRETILITGASGLLGSYILQAFRKVKAWNIRNPSHDQLDISDYPSLERYFRLHRPDIVVNLAAHRNATSAELQRGDTGGSAWQTNVLGTQNLSKLCLKNNVYLIHTSTDYVFSGTSDRPGPYSEKDQPETDDELLSWYGITKRKAEEVIRNSGQKAAIVRINNVTRANNILELDYVGKIVLLHQKKKLYPLFDDQVITLTYIPLLTELFKNLVQTKLTGVFHAASTDTCTPHELATYAINTVFKKDEQIKKESIDAYLHKNPRRYPKFGGLQTDQTQKKLGLKFYDWKTIVDLFAKKQTTFL